MIKLPAIKGEKLFVLLDQLTVSGGGFITNLLLARTLGLEGYGLFAAAGMAQLFIMSMSMSVTSQLYQVIYPGLPSFAAKKYTTGLLILQSSISSSIVVAASVLYFIRPGFLANYRDLLLPAGFSIAFFGLQDLLRKQLIVQGKARKAWLADMITNGSQLILLVMGASLNLLDVSVAWWVVAVTFFPAAIVSILWLGARPMKWRYLSLAMKMHKGKSLWLLGSSMLQWGSGYYFVAASGWWLGPASLGALRLAQYVFGLLGVVLQAIENYGLPKASGSSRSWQYLLSLSKKTLIGTLPLLIILSAFAGNVMSWAGSESFKPYAFIIYGLSFIYLVIIAGIPVRLSMRIQQLNNHYFTGYVLSTLFGIGFAPILIPHWGLMGVLIGLLVTQLLTLGYWLFILEKKKILQWKSYTLF